MRELDQVITCATASQSMNCELYFHGKYFNLPFYKARLLLNLLDKTIRKCKHSIKYVQNVEKCKSKINVTIDKPNITIKKL